MKHAYKILVGTFQGKIPFKAPSTNGNIRKTYVSGVEREGVDY
jgi:hypothetical protein